MTSRQPDIAIIEDNTDLREELIFFLQSRGYSAWGVNSAESFWKKLHRSPADIVLVDLGLPGEDGFSVVEYLSQMGGLGRIIITARGQQQDRIRGLNLGADLYLVKPVNFSELVSALEALWKRMQQDSAGADTTPRAQDKAEHWGLLDTEHCLVTPEGSRLPLSPQEYALLNVLGRTSSEIFSKEALLDLMFQHEEDSDPHRIDVILSRLRKKARQLNIDLPIRSIFGKGLVFVGKIKKNPSY